jgi:hypothetical protein
MNLSSPKNIEKKGMRSPEKVKKILDTSVESYIKKKLLKNFKLLSSHILNFKMSKKVLAKVEYEDLVFYLLLNDFENFSDKYNEVESKSKIDNKKISMIDNFNNDKCDILFERENTFMIIFKDDNFINTQKIFLRDGSFSEFSPVTSFFYPYIIINEENFSIDRIKFLVKKLRKVFYDDYLLTNLSEFDENIEKMNDSYASIKTKILNNKDTDNKEMCKAIFYIGTFNIHLTEMLNTLKNYDEKLL